MNVRIEITKEQADSLLDALDIALERTADDVICLKDPHYRAAFKEPAEAVKLADARQRAFRSLHTAIDKAATIAERDGRKKVA